MFNVDDLNSLTRDKAATPGIQIGIELKYAGFMGAGEARVLEQKKYERDS